ncbi:MAG TPA: hypothetical protein ENG63_09575 [Candidatus Desulfofervidus auxilii]|uniref:Uncharacterized protein n=1 Tax=Desulfofervidus auxilii TaxID=1621989 RepID=A0A7C0Y6S5_DESA2|nr:MAG: hypothetical protein DRP58_02610 [Spirochaetota bacterium]HDD45089.1 hypothetical protein [Candidatus Desulfofervidus auxilii]
MNLKNKKNFKNFFLGLLQTRKIKGKYLSLLFNLYLKYGHNLLERISTEKIYDLPLCSDSITQNFIADINGLNDKLWDEHL